MAEHNIVGEKGEKVAVEYLKNNGYVILETNWRHKHEEVDIIAHKQNMLVVAEVKTRSGNFFGEPEEFVSKIKQKHIIAAANAYIEEHERDEEVRFDIVSVIYQGKNYKVNHIEDAFYARL